MKFHLTEAELFQVLANHFGISGTGRWVMHLDVPRGQQEGGGYTVDVEFERYDADLHSHLTHRPMLRLVKP